MSLFEEKILEERDPYLDEEEHNIIADSREEQWRDVAEYND